MALGSATLLYKGFPKLIIYLLVLSAFITYLFLITYWNLLVFFKVHSGQILFHVVEKHFQSRYQNYTHLSSSEYYCNLLNRAKLVQLSQSEVLCWRKGLNEACTFTFKLHFDWMASSHWHWFLSGSIFVASLKIMLKML